MEDLITGYPVTIDIQVAWGEMDAFNHVNNTVYFRYFENVRIVYFKEIGFIEAMRSKNIGPILASLKCEYKTPLVYPDQIIAGTKVTHIEEDRFVMEYIIASRARKRIAAIGEGVLVAYDYGRNKKTPIPDEIREGIIRLEKIKQPG